MSKEEKTIQSKFKSYEDFCNFIIGNQFSWFDRNGMMRLKGGGVAKLMLSTKDKSDIYSGFKLTIINPKSGVVDGKFFSFRYYWQAEANYCLEGRSMKVGVYKTSPGGGVIVDTGRTPEEYKHLREVIFNYIAFFEE